MKTYWMILAVTACCIGSIAGCNKKSPQPHEPSDSDGLPVIHDILAVDVEEKIAPPPSDVKPAPPLSTAEPAKKDAPPAAPQPAANPAPRPEPKTVATAKPNPLKAAFNKKDVLAVAEDTPRRPAPKTGPTTPKPADKPKDTSPSKETAAKTQKTAGASDDKNADPELKAAQEVVVALYQAVETANPKAYEANLTFSNADKPMVGIMWSLVKEMNGFEKDMKKTYGQAGVDAVKKSQLARMGMAPPSLDDIKSKMAVKITGNKAKATLPGQSQPIPLVKVNGKWKVQLAMPDLMRTPQGQMVAKSIVNGVKNARKNIGKPGYTPQKIMAMVNSSLMPGPGAIPANMKLPKGGKR
ncbi:MAG: hypothetical protein JXA11_02605 [Phycisphaerae bacterium]|nr:hypothetical protein [Phycisphaerae bacterium]